MKTKCDVVIVFKYCFQAGCFGHVLGHPEWSQRSWYSEEHEHDMMTEYATALMEVHGKSQPAATAKTNIYLCIGCSETTKDVGNVLETYKVCDACCQTVTETKRAKASGRDTRSGEPGHDPRRQDPSHSSDGRQTFGRVFARSSNDPRPTPSRPTSQYQSSDNSQYHSQVNGQQLQSSDHY